MCVCVSKKGDIFIDWSLWSVVGSIILSKLWFEHGLSSNQIRTNDVRNVVLLVVDSSSIHHYIFWVWPMLFPCLLNFGTPSIWKPGWIVVELIDNISILSMILLSIKLVLETFISIIFVSRSWSICLDEEDTSSNSHALDVSCRREFEKVCFASSGIIPSQLCMCEVFYGLLDWSSSSHMNSVAPRATNWFVQGEES